MLISRFAGKELICVGSIVQPVLGHTLLDTRQLFDKSTNQSSIVSCNREPWFNGVFNSEENSVDKIDTAN